jgi:hypothetical protein
MLTKFNMLRAVLMSVFMPMIMFVFVRATLLLGKHLARQFLFPVYEYIYLGRADTAAIHSRNFQAGPDVQGRGRVFEEFRRHSSIDQCAEKHVAAHSRKAVEIRYAHRKSVVGRSSLVVGQNFSTKEVRQRGTNDKRPLTNGIFIIGNHGTCVKPRRPVRFATISLSSTA